MGAIVQNRVARFYGPRSTALGLPMYIQTGRVHRSTLFQRVYG